MTIQPSAAPRGLAVIQRPVLALVQSVVRRSREANPVALAEDSDLLTRWPLGRRTILPLRSVVILIVITPFVVLNSVGALHGNLGEPLQLVSTVLLALMVATTLFWFFPVGRLRERAVDSVQPGEWICVGGSAFSTFTASAVIVSKTLGAADGEQYIGTQNGYLWQRSTQPTLPVVEILDPFRSWRTEAADADLPEWLPLVELCETVLEHTKRKQRTKEAWAAKATVAEALYEDIQDADLIDRTIAAAKNLGLMDRTIRRKDTLALSAAGEAWLATVREENNLESETSGSDLSSIVRQAVEEALTQSAPIAESTELWDFADWVSDLVMTFKDWVEHSAVYESLWTAHGVAQDERAVQAVAYGIFRAFCQAADVDLNKESNAGNGPVDFKFSTGWELRALLEIKLMKSTQLLHGATKQLPQYMFAESISCGFYVCVGFDDSDFRPERIQRVRDACTEAAAMIGYELRPVFVDARRRPSASRS